MSTRSSRCVDRLYLLLKRKPMIQFPYILKRSKERKNKIKISLFLSLSIPYVRPLLPFLILSFLFSIIIIIIWIYDSYCLNRVHFYSKTIYFFSVQFILNERSSSHFMSSEIFVKISSLKSLMAYHLENRKNIPLVSEFDELFWVTRFLETNFTVQFVLSFKN